MKQVFRKEKKWRNCIILGSLLSEVEDYCKEDDSSFANPTQFVGYAVRKELDSRQKDNGYSRMFTEEQIREKLEVWISRFKSEMDLESKLESAMRNDKSHTKLLSENT